KLDANGGWTVATARLAMAYPGSQLYTQALAENIILPPTWKDYSQHGYAAQPMSNQHCSAADILEFRDNAFTTYFTHDPYLKMVEQKFGADVVDHINRMVEIPLRRKLLEERRAA
ncbi:MAG: B12-binding domain-containing radical SAM protein, partial [Proteobacteria bacterium]|nr:B12-binding domain-containing radical SAM protein [Pseudomonadota bacterium]